ncbi:Fe-S protein [Mycolicibacterium wolinskyi]|uniref:Fe-S protein n=1 Tax=Mycolicibacterium wolinskyi TaxID=59750 RepID=A0A132PJP8_9MYCO|nr:Fe-S protein [Mycolicibacterium wolinskyi]KWX22568.1 Fe-S protein [Mycolicibacterium wolinskyi]
MDLLRNVVVYLHLIGFAVMVGAWVAEAAARRFQITKVMDYGITLSLVTGLVLAAPWPAGIELNYPKIGVKLVILIALGAVLGIGRVRERRTGRPVMPLFIAAGVLPLLAAGIAVLWT